MMYDPRFNDKKFQMQRKSLTNLGWEIRPCKFRYDINNFTFVNNQYTIICDDAYQPGSQSKFTLNKLTYYYSMLEYVKNDSRQLLVDKISTTYSFRTKVPDLGQNVDIVSIAKNY